MITTELWILFLFLQGKSADNRKNSLYKDENRTQKNPSAVDRKPQERSDKDYNGHPTIQKVVFARRPLPYVKTKDAEYPHTDADKRCESNRSKSVIVISSELM